MFIFSHIYVHSQECVYKEVIAKFWASSLMDSPKYVWKMMCVNVLPVCKCMHHNCGWWSWRPKKGIISSETGITGGWVLACEGWKLKLVPVKDSTPYSCQTRLLIKQGPINLSIIAGKQFLDFAFVCLPSSGRRVMCLFVTYCLNHGYSPWCLHVCAVSVLLPKSFS